MTIAKLEHNFRVAVERKEIAFKNEMEAYAAYGQATPDEMHEARVRMRFCRDNRIACTEAVFEKHAALSRAHFETAQETIELEVPGPELAERLDTAIASRRTFLPGKTFGRTIVGMLISSQNAGGFGRIHLDSVYIETERGKCKLSRGQKNRAWQVLADCCPVRGDDTLAPPFRFEWPFGRTV